METDDFLSLLKEAKGNPALFAHAQIELLRASETEEERLALQAALQAAAIPHWFDGKFLGALLDEPLKGRAGELAGKLRSLPFTEPFRARGEEAANVHEATRRAVRKTLSVDNPDRFRELSTRAQKVLPSLSDRNAAPHLRVEALYHGFIVHPQTIADSCGAAFDEWDRGFRYESLLALRTVLEELLDEGQWALSPGIVRGAAFYYLGRIRQRYPRIDDKWEKTEEYANHALREFEASGVVGRIIRARDLRGDVLIRKGSLKQAIKEYKAAIDLVTSGSSSEGDAREARFVSIAYQKIAEIQQRRGHRAQAEEAFRRSRELRHLFMTVSAGSDLESVAGAHLLAGNMFYRQRNYAAAINSFRACLRIRERLAGLEPGNAHRQSELAAAHFQIGFVLRDQGETHAAIDAFRAGMREIESLANRYPTHAEWQAAFAKACARIAKILIQISEGSRAEALGADRAQSGHNGCAGARPPTDARRAKAA
jgi:tetratricopeptide (TPR) repeat protein